MKDRDSTHFMRDFVSCGPKSSPTVRLYWLTRGDGPSLLSPAVDLELSMSSFPTCRPQQAGKQERVARQEASHTHTQRAFLQKKQVMFLYGPFPFLPHLPQSFLLSICVSPHPAFTLSAHLSSLFYCLILSLTTSSLTHTLCSLTTTAMIEVVLFGLQKPTGYSPLASHCS